MLGDLENRFSDCIDFGFSQSRDMRFGDRTSPAAARTWSDLRTTAADPRAQSDHCLGEQFLGGRRPLQRRSPPPRWTAPWTAHRSVHIHGTAPCLLTGTVKRCNRRTVRGCVRPIGVYAWACQRPGSLPPRTT